MISIINLLHQNIINLKSGGEVVIKIVSGGQTGVDRAALDAAICLNVPFGGWCPKGRIDELGLIPSKYDQLIEVSGDFTNDQDNYEARTKLNIRDSDGTLIIVPSIPLPIQLRDGTLLTIAESIARKKPYLLLSLSDLGEDAAFNCVEWVNRNHVNVLNIAGPRESSSEGIHKISFDFISFLLPKLSSSLVMSI